MAELGSGIRSVRYGGYPVSAEQVLTGTDAAGIARAALQVPTWFCGRDEDALECAKKSPDRFAVMARPVLDDPGEASRLHEPPGVLGRGAARRLPDPALPRGTGGGARDGRRDV